MNKKDIEEYILKLSQIEKELSDDSEEDIVYLKELDNILLSLRDDIASSQQKVDYNDDFSIKVKIKKLSDSAVIPSYSKDGDAGMDMVATKIISETNHQITYGTDISMEIPKNFVGLVFPRSSIRKYDLDLSNSVGVIDSGYRGEIQATFNKINELEKVYKIGDRICQIIIIPHPQIKFIESENLQDSERGDGGFGSTGE